MGRYALTPLGWLVKAAAFQPGCEKDHLSEKALGHTRSHILALKFHVAVRGGPAVSNLLSLNEFSREPGMAPLKG